MITQANSIFEQPWWLNIVAPGEWGCAVINGHEGNIVARLPYVFRNGRISLPHYTQTLGIWMDQGLRSYKRGNEHLYDQKEVIHGLLEQLPVKRNIDFVFDNAFEYILPFRWEGYDISPTFSYRVNVDKDISVIQSNFSKNIRRDISRGNRQLFLDDAGNAIDEFIDLQNLTYKRQNRLNPINNSFTYAVIRKAIDDNHGKLLIVRDIDGNPHAGGFLLFDNLVCYNLMTGQDTGYGNDGAMPFLLYNEMLFASSISRIFDFEGSMIEGIEQVYRRFGGYQVINWHVSKESMFGRIKASFKPQIKRFIGYKI